MLRTRTLIAALSAFLVVGAVPNPGVTASCWTNKTSEKRFKRMINRERVTKDKRKIHLDPELSRAARKQSQTMLDQDRLHHTVDLHDRITNWQYLGENVGYGWSVESLHDAFMASEGHRHNVLYPDYRNVGVGVAKKKDKIWVTVIFEGRSDPGTTLHMPRCGA